MAEISQIKPTPLSPSERLQREILSLSVADKEMTSDVVVIWTDIDGMQHMRSAINERAKQENR